MHPKLVLASLYRRAFVRKLQPEARPLIVWLIPFVSRANSSNWEAACTVLEQTLNSVRQVRYDNWAVVLVCQDRPPVLPSDDPRFHFVEAPPQDLSKGISDHRLKSKLGTDYAIRHFEGVAYVSHLDADDLIHPDLPGWIARDGNGSGYIIDKGYMIDAQTGELAPMGLAPGQRLFWEHCGSCGYFAVDFTRQRAITTHLRIIGKGHKNYIRRAASVGRPLTPVPFPAMMYVVNHGENVQTRRGNNKLSYIDNFRVEDPAEVSAIQADFGIRIRPERVPGGVLEVPVG